LGVICDLKEDKLHISAQTAGDFGLIRPPVSGQSATDFSDFATGFGPIRFSCGLRASVHRANPGSTSEDGQSTTAIDPA
jgi:hypothetical protein